MPKQCGRSVVKTGEKIDRSVVKTGEKIDRNVVKTDVTRGKMVIETAYAKALKTLAPDAAQMLRQKGITEEPEAKIINARGRLTVPDSFKVTEKVTTDITDQTVLSAIAVDISK